jgi:hypothetical protein
MRAILLGTALLPLLATLAGCPCTDPCAGQDLPTPPDAACRFGVEAGDDVYLWECVDGSRVVIAYGGSAFAGCPNPPERHEAPCGELTGYETANGGESGLDLASCDPPPAGWCGVEDS